MISSALAAFAVVSVVAASDALILVQGLETRTLAGGLEVKVRTTGKPSYTTYVLQGPARLAIDFEKASVDVEKWADLPNQNPYFEKVNYTPFYSRLGQSVRLEFSLLGESGRQIEATDSGLTITFLGDAEPVQAVADSSNSTVAVEDHSGIALEILSVETPAEKAEVVELAEGLPVAVTDESIVPTQELTGSGQDWLLASLPSASAEPVVFEEQPEQSDLVAMAVPAPADAVAEEQEDELLAQPILQESHNAPVQSATRIDFRELEEAATLDSDLRVGESRFPGMVELAQAQGNSIGLDTLQFDKQVGESFTGAPITLDLKAVDVTELLRIFADLSNMNIIVDPGIRGRVTVKMKDVPWDQAFITILRNQGLGFTVEGNIIRIATLRKLNSEIRAQRALREAQLVAEPLNTEIVYLNYAAPTQIRKLLVPQLSRRGQILTDARTNSLIVKDVQDAINRVKRLVEILDVRTKQISIDAQIVTTTKAFTRDLGIIWGGSLVASPETGNDTGLPFPNDISTEFGVNLPAGSAGQIRFDFGNVLDTVNLNAILGAAEAEGNSKTVSNPRVTTSDNVQASVRAGSIIPYQSVSVSGQVLVGTVVFREAAVSLSVTPHVTSDNYVRLRVNINADAPDFSAGTNAGPVIQTNSLTTTVLVKDGDTFVIGGLNSSIEGSNQQRVPFLHRLPVIGKLLFRNQRMSNSYDDLLMFLTPRIVQDEATRQRSLVFESYELKGSDQPASSPGNP